ncbi:schlafen family member 13-like [Rhea pennata]|uniref:schlafen family member 13-like n=1 Tax=Rhea pennata TaxID=8795 RepID=UPI002E252AB5
MALEKNQQQQPSVDLATKYPEIVVKVGKICFGEKSRRKISKKLRHDQKHTLASAVCALLNSGGGVVKAEIENENYSFERDGIGLDIEETFRSLLLSPDLVKYLDFEQQDNYLLIFIKTWSSEKSSLNSSTAKPRICSLTSGLYIKCGASLSHMTPTEAFGFLEEKQAKARRRLSSGPVAKKRKIPDVEGIKYTINNTVAELFNRDQLQYGETLNFTESEDVEFKHYSTEKFLTRVKESLPQYISGFANANGGYLWIGVDDDRRVQGFSSSDEDLKNLSQAIISVQYKLTLFHFCDNKFEHNIMYKHKILKVYNELGEHCGYVCAVKIEPFTCPVFSEDPCSWLVDSDSIKRLKASDWAAWMTSADPDLSQFSDTFKLELSLTEGPPLAKPVYSHQGLESIDELHKQLFPVKSNSITYTPEKLREDLLQEYPGLANLLEEQLKDLSEGVLIFSRSWAVEIGLPDNQFVICDVLLIAKGRPPTLYTVCEPSHTVFAYSRRTAWRLKQKLVNTGGYTHKLCVIPKLLTLLPEINYEKEWDLDIQEMYPPNYGVINSYNLNALLRALTVALLNFQSFLSDRLGSEFFNLLTIKQYQLLSENLHKTKKLYVYGLPGTGKTVVALKIIEKIRNMFLCEQEEVLYICENQPLRDFVKQKNICRAVTRVTFLTKSFDKVKHIVVDEAQNFQGGDGDWYKKAQDLTSSQHLSQPGILWIFLDYLQTSHCFSTGLPPLHWHDPVESLTKVVRNANSIYCYVKATMEDIVENSILDIPRQRLEGLLCKATCAHAVQGCVKKESKLDRYEIAKYVVKHCHRYLQMGYAENDIAILCYRDEEVRAYSQILKSEIRKSKSNMFLRKMEGGLENGTVLDSIRRFSGLERSIVFGIIPVPMPSQEAIFKNILVCVASRANLQLHLLFDHWV